MSEDELRKIDRLEEESGKLYAPEIVASYLSILEEVAKQNSSQNGSFVEHYDASRSPRRMYLISVSELEKGMMLARDLYSVGHTLLLPIFTVLSRRHYKICFADLT